MADKIELLKIDEVLKDLGLSREILIQKDSKYQEDLDRLDKFYVRYDQAPSDPLANAMNNMVVAFIQKLKKENAEFFSIKKEELPQEQVIENTFKQAKVDFLTAIESGNQDAIDDIFNAVGTELSKRLLIFDNYKAYITALKTKNDLVIGYLSTKAEELGVFTEIVTSKDGIILNQILASNNAPVIKLAVSAAAANPEEAAKIFKKYMVLEQAIETGDEELAHQVEELYEKLNVTKKVEKAKKVIKEHRGIKEIVAEIAAGNLPLNTLMVAKMEQKVAMRILETDAELVNNPTYRFVVRTAEAAIFDEKFNEKLEANTKMIFSDSQYTVYETKTTDFERRFGVSVYELGFAWFNMLNLLSINDMLALMYLANISTSLLVDRDNQGMRTEYKEKLKVVFQYPESNKIGGRFYQLSESNMKSLQRSGFLDAEYCPTKLMYCAVVLHSFPFPAYTHPFEYVNIDQFNSVFQFPVLKGDYGNETFYTDGDILYHNFNQGSSPVNSKPALVDLSRTVILNLKSNNRKDLTKERAVIKHFIPLLYSIPRSGVTIPTFTIKALEVDNRKINWGAYEFEDSQRNSIFVNSYGIDNFLSRVKNDQHNIYAYHGKLSEDLFANPEEGIIIEQGNKYVTARSLNKISFLSENFGKNYEAYYKEMFGGDHLIKRVLEHLNKGLVKAIYTSNETRVESVNPNLLFKTIKKYEAPVDINKTSKPAVQVKKVIVPVARKDDRVYIGKQQSREVLDESLWPVYDKIHNYTGKERDEAILDEMYRQGVKRIFPDQLVYLGFDLKQWAVTQQRVKFENKYQLRIPNLLSYTYYLEKLQ